MDDYHVSPIDLSKLETQLRLAIHEDEKYQKENAAKFRAIEQSKTYEEFRNIVKASHLKPLDKHDSLFPKDMRPAPWNSCAFKKLINPSCGLITSAITSESDTEQILDEMLKSELGYHNFHQFWLLFSKDLEGRLKLLEKAFLVEDIFKGHAISVDLIVGIMKTLNDSVGQNLKISDEIYDLVIKIMTSVCSTPRFSLHVLFMSEKERSVINQLKENVKTYMEMKGKQEATIGGVNMSLEFLDDL